MTRLFRFLTSSNSNLLITKDEADVEHTRSTLACLQSGVDVFLKPYPEHNRIIRVVKGFHGFHVYATELWTEYVLQLADMGTLHTHPALLELASSFVASLQDIYGQPCRSPSIAVSDFHDERLAKLDWFPGLQFWIQEALTSTSLKQLETNIRQEAATVHAPEDTVEDTDNSLSADKHHTRDPISKMLDVYQKTVRYLLHQNTYSGVSDDDLSLFQRQFQDSAFTCRFKFCPRATTGFTTKEQCRLHEIAHTHLVPCTYPDCQYPPFTSSQSLQNHIKKHHLIQPALRPIRQNRNTATQRSSATEHNVEAEMTAPQFAWTMVDQENTPSNNNSVNDERRGNEILNVASQRSEGVDDSPPSQDVWALTEWGAQYRAAFDSGYIDFRRFGSPVLGPGASTLIAKVDYMGFYKCSISNCMKRISSNLSREAEAGLGHYWTFHSAPSLLRCVVGCQQIFSRKEDLGAHFITKHCTAVCIKCDPKEFATAFRLYQHWSSTHNDWVESESAGNRTG